MTTKYADAKLSEAIAGAQDTMLNKLMKRKSRLEVCDTMIWKDEELSDIEIYYRKVNECPNAQTDEPEDYYTIECAKIDGEEIRLPGNIEQDILIWLEENKKP